MNKKHSDEIAQRALIEEELRSINDFVIASSRMQGVDDLCRFAAKIAQSTTPGSIVIVTFHEPGLGGPRVRALEGLGERLGELMQIIGVDPTVIGGSASGMGEKARAVSSLFTSGHLETIPGGLETICDGMIPAGICRTITESFGIEEVHTVGLSLGEQVMGGLTILLPSGVELRQGRVIETIALHLAVLLNRSLAESALRESEARFRALWEHSIVGTMLSAPDGRIFSANPAACRMFGRTEAEICSLGRSGLADVTDPRLPALLKEREERGSASGETMFVRADGTRFPALCSSAVFQTVDGPRTCMVVQDISGLERAERQIREFSRQLLSVGEDEKRRLSAVLHHDVGSISVGMSARLQAAEEDLRDGRSSEALASIEECRRIFAQAIKRLKALAVDLRPPDLDVLGLTAALRQHFLELSKASPLRIHFSDATDGVEIGAEAQTILFRAAQECLNNIVKHAHSDWARVRLTVTKRLLRLTVSDGGRGFDTNSRAGGSRGHLGLRAMQEMASSLGGDVVIESANGQGTTIRILIPRHQESA